MNELHLGNKVKERFKELQLTNDEAAQLFGLTKEGLRRKVDSPHFGTSLDLLKASIVFKKDFFAPLLEILHRKGIELEAFPQLKQYEQVIIENQEMKEDLSLYRKVINNLPG